MADSTLSFLIAKCYAGQKRTGRGKQFVFINGNEIWKGPYKQERIDTIFERSKILKSWNTPLIVHPLRVEGEWIIFPNISVDYPLGKTFMNTESFTGISYWVAERNVVEKMNYSILKNKWIYDVPEVIEACVHLWILGVGDTGFANILVDQEKKKIYVVDYEENVGKIRDGECFYFSKDPAKKFKWYENMARYYVEISNRLDRLKYITLLYSLEISKAIDLLRKHGKDNVIVEDIKMKEIREVADKMKGLAVSNNGQMEWRGMFGGSTTYSGYKVDVIKSGLQKYIRRGMHDKALYCAFELYRMGEVGGEALVTNLYNRLKIIAAEDIGMGDFNVAITVIDCVNKNNRDPGVLVSMVKMLSSAEKTRIGSHLCNTYKRPECKSYAESKGISIDSGYTDSDEKFIQFNTNNPIFKDIENPDLKACAMIFYKRLSEKDFNAVTWWGFFEYYVNKDNLKIKMRNAYHDGDKWRRSSKPISILFDMIDNVILDDNTKYSINILKHTYFNMPDAKPTKKNPNPRSEHRCIFVLAITSVLFNVIYEKIAIIPDSNRLDELLNSRYKLEIDDYVIDKHTLEGASKGKNRQDFVNQGALIHPENMKYHYPDLVDVYENCKEL